MDVTQRGLHSSQSTPKMLELVTTLSHMLKCYWHVWDPCLGFPLEGTRMDITQHGTPTRMFGTRHGPLIHNTELQTHNTERAFPTRITTCFQEQGVPHNDLGKQRFFRERAQEK